MSTPQTQSPSTTPATQAPAAAPAAAASWQLDASHTTAQFSVRHMMVTTVRGQFGRVSGRVLLDEADLARSSVEVEIEAASIDTREPKRDAHLRSPDFFDVEKFPHITFKSTAVRAKGDGLALTGDLTMHGVTHPVTLTAERPSAPVKTAWGTWVRGVSATARLSRKDWGLTWNAALEAGGVLVGDEVKLQIDAELVQASAAGASA